MKLGYTPLPSGAPPIILGSGAYRVERVEDAMLWGDTSKVPNWAAYLAIGGAALAVSGLIAALILSSGLAAIASGLGLTTLGVAIDVAGRASGRPASWHTLD